LQANNFIKKFHTEKINKLQLILDSENWRQTVVPSEFQHLVEYIQTTGIYADYLNLHLINMDNFCKLI
jgi:hypothetical protein